MKILYVKTNSERGRKFQLRTTIYEENGQKFVKKESMTPEALPHLMGMKENYTKLSESIIDTRIKLVPIVAETQNSLTFAFIDGLSLEKKYQMAQESEVTILRESYISLIQNGFKTTTFDAETMVTEQFKALFGDRDYSTFNGEPCFQEIANIDLIFSNLIYKDEDIYLIDYEWVFTLNIPLSFALFRTFHEDNALHWQMEKHFVFDYIVGETGFLNLQKQYSKKRLQGLTSLLEKDAQINDLETIIEDKERVLSDKERHIQIQEHLNKKALEDKNRHIRTIETQAQQAAHIIQQLSGDIEHWHNIARSMTLKGRIKKLAKKVFPATIVSKLRQQKTVNATTQTIERPLPSVTVNEYRYHVPTFTKVIQKELETELPTPLISIIMPVYNVDPHWLKLAIDSIKAQWYTHWELCIVDDKSTNKETLQYLKEIDDTRIRVVFLEKNMNISGASNAALAMTKGTYIVLMDNDDEITPDALYEVVKAIHYQNAEFIYSDEDKLEMDGTHSDPHFKPNFAPDMFLSHNYLSHLGAIKKTLLDKTAGFTLGLEGSQDYDLYLQVLEHTDKIYHIPKVLYHWRKIPGSTAAEYGEKSYAQDAGRKALQNAMQRRNIAATVKNGQTPGTYKVDYTLTDTPLVSIIIPFKDKPELIKVCIESLLEKTTYKNFEVIAISNNSEEEATFKEMSRLSSLDNRISFYEYNVPFNYSDINNHAVKTYTKGEQILFLNNDIEIISPTWIEEMLMYSQQPQNGAIGAKLYFPNDTVQHAGLVMAPHTQHSVIIVYQGFPKGSSGYGARLSCVNNYSAVTAACLMLKRSIFDEILGFDAQNLSVAYNDVDLCLRIQEAGYSNVWTPYAELYHHESISRGYEISRDAVERREKEKYALKMKHPVLFITGDPYYNPNLTRFANGFQIDERHKVTASSVLGIPYYEEILSHHAIHLQEKDKVTIFSHFDTHDTIDAYVIEYLKSLSVLSDVVFVSTAENLSLQDIESIKPYCRDIVIKKNVGYDFGAWKSGLDLLGTDVLASYETLILCNDSAFGPLFDLIPIFKQMAQYDFWAMSDNHEIDYHLQSYFMVYNTQAFTHTIFTEFWDTLKIFNNKQALIENNEIGFSRAMMASSLSYSSYYQAKEKNYVNVLQYYWKELIAEHQFPFVKKEVLTSNPLQLDITDWEEVIESHTTYNTTLIKDYLG